MPFLHESAAIFRSPAFLERDHFVVLRLPHPSARGRKTSAARTSEQNHKNHKTMKTSKTNKASKTGKTSTPSRAGKASETSKASKTKRVQGPPYKANGSPEEQAAGDAAFKFIGYLMLHPLATQEEASAVHERLNVPASIGLMRWARRTAE
jgi:hypothetical protein